MIATPELVLAQQPVNNSDGMREQALRLIPNDATAALIAHPRAMLTAPGMETMPIEVFSAFGRQEFGFDPLDVQLAVAAVQVYPQQSPDAAMVLRFRKAISLQDLPPGITQGMREGELHGKPYLKSDDGRGFYMPGETTLMFGTEGMIRSMLKRDGTTEGRLHRHLVSGPISGVQLVVALDSVRGVLNAQLQQMPGLPGGLEALKRIPDFTDAVEVHAAAAPLRGEISLHAIDQDGADQIERIFDRAIHTGKLMAQEAVRYNVQGKGEVEQASRAYADRMIDMFTAGLKPSRKGNTVVLGGEVGSQAEIAVLGTLVALLLPAVQAAREAARRNRTMNNGRQLILAMLNHEAAYRRFPAHAIYDEEGKKPLLSWRVKILPFIEEQALYKKFHLDEPWDSPHNKELIGQMPDVFLHAGDDRTDGKTHFLGVSGEGNDFVFHTGATEGRRLRDITDGMSNSIAIVEADEAVIWTKPEDFKVDPDNPAKGLGGLRPGEIFQAIYCDGHVSAVSKGIDAGTLKAMFTINGGEAIR